MSRGTKGAEGVWVPAGTALRRVLWLLACKSPAACAVPSNTPGVYGCPLAFPVWAGPGGAAVVHVSGSWQGKDQAPGGRAEGSAASRVCFAVGEGTSDTRHISRPGG